MKLIFDGPDPIAEGSGRQIVFIRFDHEDGGIVEPFPVALYGTPAHSPDRLYWHASIIGEMLAAREGKRNVPLFGWILDAIQKKLRELNGEVDAQSWELLDECSLLPECASE